MGLKKTSLTDGSLKIYKLNLDKEIITPSTMRSIIKNTKEVTK